MPKFILRPFHTQNLGGYVVETYAKLPYRDVVVGNPTNEMKKIEVPVYSEETFKEYEKQGIIVLPIYAGDSLEEALKKVRALVEEAEKKIGAQ